MRARFARRGGACGAGSACGAGGGLSAAGGTRFARVGFFLAGLLSMALWVPLAAQTESQVPAVLTFDAAVAVALENSPAYLRQVNAVAASEHVERQSAGALLPSVSASFGYRGYSSRNKTAFDELGRPLEEPDFVENTTSSAAQSLGGSVDLLNLQNVRSWGAARAQTDAVEARVELQAAQLRTQVGTDYYDVVQREQLVAVEERALNTARDQLAAIRQLMRVAAKQPTDVLGAELDVARAEQALQRARGDSRKAHLSLRQRMGVPLALPFDVVPTFLDVFDPASLDAAALIRRALEESARMAEQRAAVAAAEHSLSAARAARFPTLTGSYGYSRGTSARDYDAFGQLDLPNTSWQFGLGVEIPLFNRFQTSAAIGRAGVDAENARETAREAALSLEHEVRAALIDLENAYTGVRLAERSAEIARERLRQGQEQYRVGRLQDYTALQQMIDAVAQQERAVTTAYFNFSVALLTLEEKVGGPLGVSPVDG